MEGNGYYAENDQGHYSMIPLPKEYGNSTEALKQNDMSQMKGSGNSTEMIGQNNVMSQTKGYDPAGTAAAAYYGSTGGDNWQSGQKRNDSGFQTPWPKKRKNPNPAAKNPVSFLNEIRPDTAFQVSDMEGPSNMPTFKVSLEFDGETYTASAKSKKMAKRYVAEAALKVYLNTTAAAQLGYSESQIEFSEGPMEGVTTGGSPVVNETKAVDSSDTAKADESIGGKNPVMYLNELKKDAVYDLKEETGQAHNKNFIMRVSVEGQEFEGTGQNKKIAKAAAARQALKSLGLVLDGGKVNEDDQLPTMEGAEDITKETTPSRKQE